MSSSPASRHGWRAGSLAGVPIYLGRSWLLIAAAIIAIFGPMIGRNRPDLGGNSYLVAAAFVVLLLVSVLVHEAAHALTARSHGFRVSRIVADFWGGHTAYDAGAGSPGPSAIVAVAGPLANGALAGIGYAIVQVVPSGIPTFLATAFAIANAIVAVFNLLPGLPLDGGYLVEAAVWKASGSRAAGTTSAGWAGRILVVLGISALVLVPFSRGYRPDIIQIVIAAALGAFLWFGASDAVRIGRARARLEHATVAALIEPARFVPQDRPLAEVLSEAAGQAQLPIVVVDTDGLPIGLLDPAAAARVEAGNRADTPVGVATSRFAPQWNLTAALDDGLEPVVGRIEQHRLAAVVITSRNGDALGLIRAKAIADLLS